MGQWRWILVWIGLAWLTYPSAAEAHVGAPYPVLLEELVGPYVVSALAWIGGSLAVLIHRYRRMAL